MGGAQYAVLCHEDGGVLDDLFTYRLAPDRFLTVTNAANHENDLAWFQPHAAAFDVEVEDRRTTTRCSPSRARRRARSSRRSPTARCPRASRPRGARSPARRRPRLRHGLHGRGRRRAAARRRARAAVWDALVRRGATPAGLGARDTLRLEVCFHLYGNDLSEERGPIEAGLGWCCKEDTGFIGADAVRAVREAGPAEKLVPFTLTGPGIARQGNPVVGGGEVTSGTLSPCLESGSAWPTCPPSGEPGTEFEIDVRGKPRPAVVRTKPLYRKEN